VPHAQALLGHDPLHFAAVGLQEAVPQVSSHAFAGVHDGGVLHGRVLRVGHHFFVGWCGAACGGLWRWWRVGVLASSGPDIYAPRRSYPQSGCGI